MEKKSKREKLILTLMDYCDRRISQAEYKKPKWITLGIETEDERKEYNLGQAVAFREIKAMLLYAAKNNWSTLGFNEKEMAAIEKMLESFKK